MSRTIVIPKPILKSRSNTPTPCHSVEKHAHFPPPSEEAKRYSGVEYDRTPIVVAHNELTIPERGCPGRTFDGIYRHHYKKNPRSSENAGSIRSTGNHVHPNYFVAAAAAAATMNLPVDHVDDGHSSFVTDSTPMPALSMIHGDTSESDGDVSSPVSDLDASLGLPTLIPELTSRAGDETKRRLRKAHQRASESRPPHGNRLHRTIDLANPPSPDSTFASCPGSSSCLGGF